MLVAEYSNHSAIAADPERANNAMFKLNNAVYKLVRVTRDEDAARNGEHRISSITVSKFRESDGQFGSSTTTSTDRYINALSSMAFPFDPYALYNAYPLVGDYTAGAQPGLLRRRRHSYSRSISPSTVMHFSCNNLRRSLVQAGESVPYTMTTVDGEGDAIVNSAFAYALLGRYPTLDAISAITVPRMIADSDSMMHVAISPSMMLGIFNPRTGGFAANLYIRDFSSPNPLAYICTRINVNITDKCVIVHCNDTSTCARYIQALEAYAPSGVSGWTYRTP